MKVVHREIMRQAVWLPYLGTICNRNIVIAIGTWFKFTQNKWEKVTCKKCLKARKQ